MEPTKSPDMIDAIGGCGKFQVFLTTAISATIAASVWGFMNMAFGSFNPGWTCLDKDIDNGWLNSSASTQLQPNIANMTSKLNQWHVDCNVKSQCKNLRYNTESSTIVSEWDLSCDLSWVPSTITAIQMSGAFVGGACSGQIGDRFGRKISLYGHVAIQCICNIVAIFSVSWQMYAVVLFILGYSTGGAMSISYPYPLEFTTEWWRAVIVGIPVWNISFLLFAVTAWVLRDWKQMHIVAAILPTLAFLPVFWTTESVRWLAVRGRTKQAKAVVARIAKINGNPKPDVRIIDDIALKEKTQMGNYIYTYLDLFKLASIRWYTLSFGIIMLTMSCSYFSIAFGIRALSGDFYINLIISPLTEIPAMFFVAPAANYFGRRKSFLIFLIIDVVHCFSLALMYLVSSGAVRDISVIVLAMICKMIIGAAWGIFNLYSSEIFPTIVRGMYFGYISLISRLAAMISPFIIPNDPEKIYISFLLMGTLGLLSCGILIFLPETKGRRLKDIADMERPNSIEEGGYSETFDHKEPLSQI